MLPFARVSIIGLGLIGSSIARAVRQYMPTVRLTGHDADANVRETARRIDLLDDVADHAGAAVTDADLVILCVPVGAMGAVAADMAADLPADAVISDVGSCKAEVARAERPLLVMPLDEVHRGRADEVGHVAVLRAVVDLVGSRSNSSLVG